MPHLAFPVFRRQVLCAVLRGLQVGWLVLACCSTHAIAQGTSTPSGLAMAEPRAGVFVHIGALENWAPSNGGDVSNSSFIVGSRCVAVVDTGGTPAVGRALREAVARTTPLPICYVINTHAHPDHMLGTVAFSEAGASRPQFVASARYVATLAAREPYYLNALQREFGIALKHEDIIYPTLVVTQSMELDLGDRVLVLQAWPTAHTDNDLTVYDKRTHTLITGDLLFAQHLPVVDGNLRSWVCAIAEFRQLDVATVVPGHGAVSHDWPAALEPQADYLQGLLRDTRAAIHNGLTLQQTVDRLVLPVDSHWVVADLFKRRNVTAAYAELEWEDDIPSASAERAACANRPGKH